MRTIRLLALLGLVAAGCSPPYDSLPLQTPRSYSQAEDDLRRGNFQPAVENLNRYLETGQEPYRARAYYQLARAQYHLENYQDALVALAGLEKEFPEMRGPQTNALRGDIAYALGNRIDAILYWEKAYKEGSESDRRLLLPRIEAAMGDLDASEARRLAGMLTVAEFYRMAVDRLPGASDNVPARPPPLAAAPATPDRLSAVEPAEGAQPAAAAAESVMAAQGLPVQEPTPASAATDTHLPPAEPGIVAAYAGEQRAAAVRIASLLPLTGPDRSYGRRALLGLRLAFADAPEVLVVRDEGGETELAVQLFRALAADPSVLAVIGPLRSSAAKGVAPVAERSRVPTLLLSQAEGLSGPYVFQIGVTQEDQARALVDYAVRSLEAERFGILYPDDGYGQAFMARFREAVKERGATLVGTNAYAAQQRDFAAQARAVQSWVDKGRVQALFIPDAAPTATAVGAAVREVAPHLILLGSESWNQAAALEEAGAQIEGAVFVDAFFAGGGSPTTQGFVSRFRLRNGYSPTGFEAQAFDAGMLARRAVNRGARTREALLADLRRGEPLEAAGRLNATDGGLERELVLLRVSQGQVEKVGP